jgi:hypothetical protein
MALNTAVVPPTPSAIVRIEVMKKPGRRRRDRTECGDTEAPGGKGFQ